VGFARASFCLTFNFQRSIFKWRGSRSAGRVKRLLDRPRCARRKLRKSGEKSGVRRQAVFRATPLLTWTGQKAVPRPAHSAALVTALQIFHVLALSLQRFASLAKKSGVRRQAVFRATPLFVLSADGRLALA